MQAAEATGASDAGFIADKAMWMRATGNSWGARDLLARRAVLAFRPCDTEEWYEALLTNAQAAANDRQWTTAYAIRSEDSREGKECGGPCRNRRSPDHYKKN